MKPMKVLIFLIGALFCLNAKIAPAYSHETGKSTSSIVYLKDGEGIFVYDLATKETRHVYKNASPNQYFSPERLIFYKDYIIFGVYRANNGFPHFVEYAPGLHKWQEEFYIINNKGGEVIPYSAITYEDKDIRMNLLLKESFHKKDMTSVFSHFPSDIKLIGDQTGGSPQIHALYKNVNNKCAFVAGDTNDGTPDKTIRLWDLEANKIETVLEFYDKHLPIVDGGGGYDYPYLLNENEIIFFEYPRERGMHTWVGIGLCRWAYLKKFNIQTGESVIIDKLNGLAEYPKISPSGRFVVYGIKNEKMSAILKRTVYNIFIKDIQTGMKTKIDIGHSFFWMK